MIFFIHSNHIHFIASAHINQDHNDSFFPYKHAYGIAFDYEMYQTDLEVRFHFVQFATKSSRVKNVEILHSHTCSLAVSESSLDVSECYWTPTSLVQTVRIYLVFKGILSM